MTSASREANGDQDAAAAAIVERASASSCAVSIESATAVASASVVDPSSSSPTAESQQAGAPDAQDHPAPVATKSPAKGHAHFLTPQDATGPSPNKTSPGVRSPSHLTSPASRPHTPLQSLFHRRHAAEGSMRVAHGIPIPHHMLSPLQDGYRTPTGEDYEHHRKQCAGTPSPTEVTSRIQHLSLRVQPAHAESPRSSLAARLTQTHGVDGSGHSRRVSVRSHLSLSAVPNMLDEKLEWRQRLRHFTWNFFSINMATGGLAHCLYQLPFRFQGLDTIGTIFFFLNLILFLNSVTCISLRFLLFPETFKASFLHPTESLFVPSLVVSLVIVMLNITEYGVPNVGGWLHETMTGFFWLSVALAVTTSSSIYVLMWSTQTFTIARMTPVWIFPAYPLLVIGPFAALLSTFEAPQSALDIIIAGFTCQGIGFLVSMTIYSAFIYRLMTQKLPQESLRPGMFVSVGPSGFTANAISNMAAQAAVIMPEDFMGDGHMAGMILRVACNFASLAFWGLAVWFFLISVGAHWSCLFTNHKPKHRLPFSLTWFSFIFPNTALITATLAVGKAFGSPALQWIGCVLAAVLVLAWFLVFGAMIRAIITKQILWPQRQEDRDEGGFKAPPRRPSFLSREKPSIIV